MNKRTRKKQARSKTAARVMGKTSKVSEDPKGILRYFGSGVWSGTTKDLRKNRF